MLAGVAAYIKALQPEVKVFGVEADDAAGTGFFQCVSICFVINSVSAFLETETLCVTRRPARFL